MTTDYGEFQTLLTQAKSLERADEWTFARRDYMRTFKLLRGEPFRKMYDSWAETARSIILNSIQTEVRNFAHLCYEHGNKQDAQRVIERIRTNLHCEIETVVPGDNDT